MHKWEIIDARPDTDAIPWQMVFFTRGVRLETMQPEYGNVTGVLCGGMMGRVLRYLSETPPPARYFHSQK